MNAAPQRSTDEVREPEEIERRLDHIRACGFEAALQESGAAVEAAVRAEVAARHAR